ncbi:hypothetical protein DD238_004525 [Peronospora effusa]|uniref:Uncharacterized protein n=1 Tax=Peronospora effusa TaxID=542832 RepID=A0A3M6VHN1_9STRA|nr:hypothetical protein DD238_004525 [Peronospora effusa]RQM09441.1 hypothetical protein DD237_008160 [Peronospora effusa]
MVVTTQYNSRLGTTVSEISKNLKDVQNIQIFDKMKFPMFEPETEHHMTTDMPQHTCPYCKRDFDLLEKGYEAHVISRNCCRAQRVTVALWP